MKNRIVAALLLVAMLISLVPAVHAADTDLVNLAREPGSQVIVSKSTGTENELTDGIISAREGDPFDAGPRNRWNTYPNGGEQWAGIDFTGYREVYEIIWYALEDNAGTPRGTVKAQYFNGTDWVDLGVTATPEKYTGDFNDSKYAVCYVYKFTLDTPVYTQKVRVVTNQKTSGQYGVGATELEVLGSKTLLSLGSHDTGSKVIVSKSTGTENELADGIISSREGGNFDAGPRNRWNTWPNGGEQWAGVDFGQEQEVYGIVWYALEDHAGSPAGESVTAQYWDGSDWQPTGVNATKARYAGPYNDPSDENKFATCYVYTFSLDTPVKTSKVRVVTMQKTSGSYGVGATEIEVFTAFDGFVADYKLADDDTKLNVALTVQAKEEDRTLYVKLTQDDSELVSEQTVTIPANETAVQDTLDLSAFDYGVTITITASLNEDYSDAKTAQISRPFSASVIDALYEEMKTPYEYDVIVAPSGDNGAFSFDSSLVDNPNVFRIPGDEEYVYMTYVGHDGEGYRTGLARSKDLVTWEKLGTILDNGDEGAWDQYNAAGYIVRDHEWGSLPTPHIVSEGEHAGQYAMTYLASDTAGYEAGLKQGGVAFSDKLFNEDGTVAQWTRYEDPVLSAKDGEYAYEKGIIWKLQAIYNSDDNLYYGFYNAATGPEVMCGAVSSDLINWTRMETNPLLNTDKDPSGGTWGASHNADADVMKVNGYWVMHYFTSTPSKGIIDSFAVSTDLMNWQKSYKYMTARNSTFSSTYAHKPCVVKQNGVVYHYYCAVGNQGRVIAVDTSLDLSIIKETQALLAGELTDARRTMLQSALDALQNALIEEDGSLEKVQAALDALQKLVPTVQDVEQAIDAIGTVTLDSAEAIAKAREMYSWLTKENQALVSNYETLLLAENALSVLRADAAAAEAAQSAKEAEEAKKAAEEAQRKAEEAQRKAEEAAAKAEEAKKEQEAAEKALAEIVERLHLDCPTTKYTDIAKDAWYHKAVDFMVKNGYMNGVSDTAFDVEGSVTRGQLVTILYRIAGEPTVEGLDNPFTDVVEGSWYTNAILWAAKEGIVNGVTDTKFAPDAEITREQIVVILYRYAGAEKDETDNLKAFTDVKSISEYALEAMNWAVGKGLVNGMTETTIEPTGTATRGQICAIVQRFLEK